MNFQPTLLGTSLLNEDGEEIWITDEDETRVFVESPSSSGWLNKERFMLSIGIEGEEAEVDARLEEYDRTHPQQ